MLNRHVHNLTALLARQRPAVGILAAVLLLSAAAPVHADPVPPPARPQPPICIYPNAGLGEDACETFQDDASEYCGGDPVNRTDPMGTEWVYFTRNKKKTELKPDELTIWNATTEKGTDNDIDWGWREDGTQRPGLRPTPEEIRIAKSNLANGNFGFKAWKGVRVVKGIETTEVILDEVAVASRVPGEAFEDIAKLRSDLAKKGIGLVEDASAELPDNVAARFSVVADEAGNVRGVVKLRPGATNYEVWHELAHAEHFNQTGYQFLDMTVVEKELQTFGTLYRKYWGRLNPEEQKSAIDYIQKYVKAAGGDPKQIDLIVHGE